jgi:hypothetical protein
MRMFFLMSAKVVIAGSGHCVAANLWALIALCNIGAQPVESEAQQWSLCQHDE